MNIDHIFIFTDDNGKIADDLITFGLSEGGSRIHKGQGTINRTFVFENFYMEIVWVHDEQEIKSKNVLPTGLWTRANYKVNNCSPFGLCIANTGETEQLFKNAFHYQPEYFSDGMMIDILNKDHNLTLPWTFRLPFKGERKRETQPSAHKNGIIALTIAEFQYTGPTDKSFQNYFENEATIRFSRADNIGLTLTFDDNKQGLTKKFEELKLTINY